VTVKTPPVVHQHPTQDNELGVCSDGDLLPISENNNVEKAPNSEYKNTVFK